MLKLIFKSLFIILLALLISAPQGYAKARSGALYDVILAVADASWDLPHGPHWKAVLGRKFKRSQCELLAPSEALAILKDGMEAFASYYVDEELPYEAALAELADRAAAEIYLCDGNVLVIPQVLSVEIESF